MFHYEQWPLRRFTAGDAPPSRLSLPVILLNGFSMTNAFVDLDLDGSSTNIGIKAVPEASISFPGAWMSVFAAPAGTDGTFPVPLIKLHSSGSNLSRLMFLLIFYAREIRPVDFPSVT